MSAALKAFGLWVLTIFGVLSLLFLCLFFFLLSPHAQCRSLPEGGLSVTPTFISSDRLPSNYRGGTL